MARLAWNAKHRRSWMESTTQYVTGDNDADDEVRKAENFSGYIMYIARRQGMSKGAYTQYVTEANDADNAVRKNQ